MSRKKKELESEIQKFKDNLTEVQGQLTQMLAAKNFLENKNEKLENENRNFREELTDANCKLDRTSKIINNLEDRRKAWKIEELSLKESLQGLLIRLEDSENNLKSILHSRSWRITAPIRSIINLFR